MAVGGRGALEAPEVLEGLEGLEDHAAKRQKHFKMSDTWSKGFTSKKPNGLKSQTLSALFVLGHL